MLFIIHFDIQPKNHNKSIQRLLANGDGYPETVKILSHFGSATLLEGWQLVDWSFD